MTWTQISGENTIEVRSCATLTFLPPAFQSNVFDASKSPKFNLNLYDDGVISFSANTGMTATELLDYCGPLTFSLGVFEGWNTYFDLATQLYECKSSSCIYLTQPTAGTFDVDIKVLELVYLGSYLNFAVEVEFLMYDKRYQPLVNSQRRNWPVQK